MENTQTNTPQKSDDHLPKRRRWKSILASLAILAAGSAVVLNLPVSSQEQARRNAIIRNKAIDDELLPDARRHLDDVKATIAANQPACDLVAKMQDVRQSAEASIAALEDERAKNLAVIEGVSVVPKAEAAAPGLSFGPLPDIKIAPPTPATGYDLDKLAHAVAFAETASCTDGTALKRNNCFGIMHWPGGKRTPKYYASKEDSYADFKRIWSKFYGKFPDRALAGKWTGEDHADTWLANVTSRYNEL